MNMYSSYGQIPELSSDDILPESGFHTGDNGQYTGHKDLFIACIAEAIKNPEWAEVPKYTEEHKMRELSGLPRPQHIMRYDIESLKELQTRTHAEILTSASNLERGENPLQSGMAEFDIVVRALEIMSEYYPNLTMFRGTSFFPDRLGFTGVDFAPGGLETAMRFARRSYYGPRLNPVVVSIKFSDVVKHYVQGRLGISTENNWWRGSLEISPYGDFEFSEFTIRKYPHCEDAVQEILEDYKAKALKIDKL